MEIIFDMLDWFDRKSKNSTNHSLKLNNVSTAGFTELLNRILS